MSRKVNFQTEVEALKSVWSSIDPKAMVSVRERPISSIYEEYRIKPKFVSTLQSLLVKHGLIKVQGERGNMSYSREITADSKNFYQVVSDFHQIPENKEVSFLRAYTRSTRQAQGGKAVESQELKLPEFGKQYFFLADGLIGYGVCTGVEIDCEDSVSCVLTFKHGDKKYLTTKYSTSIIEAAKWLVSDGTLLSIAKNHLTQE